MDFLLLLKAAILGVVEGLTEFLPISSTGHLIIAESLLGFTGDSATVFAIVIQLGAILAVMTLYRERVAGLIRGLFAVPGIVAGAGLRGSGAALLAQPDTRLLLNLMCAFVPAMVLGVMFHGTIKTVLFNPITVATMLVLGGFVILWAERRQHTARVMELDALHPRDAFKVGLAQAVAMIPGTSRSGATIIGGMLFGVARPVATQFSFFLAIPTMLAATVYDVYKNRAILSMDDFGIIAVGFVAAFIVAFFTVRFMVGFVSRHSFVPFAWYRIVFGLIVLASWQFGWVDWGNVSH